MMSKKNEKIPTADEDFWYKVSQNQFTNTNVLKLDRPETPHLLNLYENSRPLTRSARQLVDPLLSANNRSRSPRFLDASSISRPGTAFSENSGYHGLYNTPENKKVQVYNLRLQPLPNAPKLPDIQARLKATQERRKLRKHQNKIINSKVTDSNEDNSTSKGGLRAGMAQLDLNRLHDESSAGDQNIAVIDADSDNSTSSKHFDQFTIQKNTYKRGNSSGDRQRPRSGDDNNNNNFSKHSNIGISDTLSGKNTSEKKRQAALNDAIEVIQNLNNRYNTAERVRSAQLAMRLSPGSQNSYAISKVMFQFSQNDLHLLASPIIVKDLLAFLAICGSKNLKKYSQSILYILGCLRSISSSWKTASMKIDMEDLCDEILEYVSLVMEVILNVEDESSKDGANPEMIQKILIQATGLVRNITERMTNCISSFQYHETFTCLFIILRRFYKNHNLVLNVTRIFSSLDMEKMLQIVPEIQNYSHFLIFSLQENELSTSLSNQTNENCFSPLNTSRFRLLDKRPSSSSSSISNSSNIDQIKNDHFTIKIIYLLGNLAEFVGAGLEYESIGNQLLDLLINYLKTALSSIRELVQTDSSQAANQNNSKKELSINCFRLLGNLAMEEKYLAAMVNNKELVTLMRIYLNLDVGLDDLLLGVIHNISSFEVEDYDSNTMTQENLPVFYQMLINDLLMSEGTVFRNACEENRIVCIGSGLLKRSGFYSFVLKIFSNYCLRPNFPFLWRS